MRSDQELIQDIRDGRLESLAPLIDRYGRDLMHYLASILNRRDKAQDVFQDTWRRVLENVGRFQMGEPFAPWVFRIARNLAFDALRRQRRWRFLGDEAREDQPVFEPAVAASFDDRLVNRDLAEAVLARLDPVFREVLSLRFFGDKSYEEIARICGLPLGTVKTRLRRALARAAELYEEIQKECQSHG